MAKHDEDLFKDTTMTFGEHLEELRGSLFKAIAGLAVGVLLGLAVGNYVVKIIEKPLTDALGNYYKSAAETEYEEFHAHQTLLGKPIPYSLKTVQGLLNKGMLFEIRYLHPAQVRPAILGDANTAAEPKQATAAVSPEVNGTETVGPVNPSAPVAPPAELFPTLEPSDLVPILTWHPVEDDSRLRITTLSAPEAFSIWIKACLVVGIILSSPWVFYHIWAFVAAGLYPHEKRYVHVFLPFSLGLFLLGASTAYLFVFAPVLEFLFSFNKWLGLDPDPRISEWMSFVMLLPLGFGISFQLPLVMLFLERIGIFDVKAYLEKWRISILVIFILSAVLTPADPYSLLLMAVPLCFLYFGGILLCHWLPKKKAFVE